MQMYTIKDLFDMANKNYNLKISREDNPKEVKAIEKTIRRKLQAHDIKSPYKVNQDQAVYLINTEMKKYFFKKAEKSNPNLILDAEAYAQTTQENISQTLTYQEALINCKLDYLIQLLGSNDQQTIFFRADDFRKAYVEYRKHIDSNGFPMPGYTNAKGNLRASEKFFTALPFSNKPFKPEKKSSK